MTTVRKTAKTTVTLLVLAIGLALLMRWCRTSYGVFFYNMEALLISKARIGRFHNFLIPFSFWLLLIESVIEVIYREKNGVHALSSFGVPFIFSMCIAVWGLAAASTWVNILWFWLFYYVGLFICIRISYKRLSSIKGAGPSKNNGNVSIVDRTVLHAVKIVMLVDWFAILIAAIMLCIRYKQFFGL